MVWPKGVAWPWHAELVFKEGSLGQLEFEGRLNDVLGSLPSNDVLLGVFGESTQLAESPQILQNSNMKQTLKRIVGGPRLPRPYS